MRLKNLHLQRIFSCSVAELKELKLACKEQMLKTHINGKPLLGQLAREVDPDGSLRTQVWLGVASSRDSCEALLFGERWGDHRPAGFEADVLRAQDQILQDLTDQARRKRARKRKKGMVPDHERDSPDISTSVQSRRVRFSKRLRHKAAAQSGSFVRAVSLEDPFVSNRELVPRKAFRKANTVERESRDALTLRKILGDGNIRCSELHRLVTSPPGETAGNHSLVTSPDPIFGLPPTGLGMRAVQASVSLPEQSPVLARNPLSLRIQQAVGRQLDDLAAKVAGFENCVIFSSDLDLRDMQLEAKLVRWMNERIARLDAKIDQLKDETTALSAHISSLRVQMEST